MNKDIFEGNWKEISGKMKQVWGKLTDDDLKKIEGNHEEIYGKLQKHYGYTKDEVKKLVHDFQKRKFH
ncbi:CsbD family protein [Legionella rowbothamii]|uniref:CsbD family protein n=1 Tax=Legionella rowbothamii TaxID=96229 RepID=UPI001056B1F8|nr:CsbD family protein [Legionella rowbothamii]